MNRIPILLDADTGVDDAIALIYALKSPLAELVGVTTVSGNTSAEQAARNSLDIIKLCGMEGRIPVAVGEKVTLRGEAEAPVPEIHGENGIGGAVLPASVQKPEAEDGPDLLIRLAKEYAGELVVVATGQLTNLAVALRRCPDLPKYVKKVVVMGGTLDAPGNRTPMAEANIVSDPEAADLVLTSFEDVLLVGLNVTMKTMLTMDHVEKTARLCRPENLPIVDFLRAALRHYMDFYARSNGVADSCAMHDGLAMLLALRPDFGTYRRWITRVDCSDGLCRGQIVPDRRRRPRLEGRFVEFAVDVEAEAAVNEMMRVLF